MKPQSKSHERLRRSARQQMGPGTARSHLENCTGKKRTNQERLYRVSRVLGTRYERELANDLQDRANVILKEESEGMRVCEEDQANKSAGWMPGH